MSALKTTTKLPAFWPAAIILLPVALLTGNLSGAWIGCHGSSGTATIATMIHEMDAIMEPYDPLGLAKFLRTTVEEALSGENREHDAHAPEWVSGEVARRRRI